MEQLSSFAGQATDQQFARYAWILSSITDEVFAEVVARAETTDAEIMEKLPALFIGFGRVMEWAGTGDARVLPPELLHIFISRYPDEIKSIESGKVA